MPPELPEPALGINFARDGMERRDWFSLIAVHSDAWLMSMAFFNAARLDAEGRRLLFNEINSLPTCLEIVLGKARGNGPIAGAAQISKRAAEPPSALHQEPGKRLAQSEYEDTQMATSELPVRLVGEMNGGERYDAGCGVRFFFIENEGTHIQTHAPPTTSRAGPGATSARQAGVLRADGAALPDGGGLAAGERRG